MLVISTILVLCVIMEKFFCFFFPPLHKSVSSSLKLGVGSRYPRF